MDKRTFFISGHRDITESEFNILYQTAILKAIKEYDAYFIVGDYEGVDIMAQNFLMDDIKYDPSKVTVCHMLYAPMNCNKLIKNTISGFNNDIERDSYMTKNSNEDIAFIRKGKENSGTAQNILRRYTFNNCIEYKLSSDAKSLLLSCNSDDEKFNTLKFINNCLLFPLSSNEEEKDSFRKLIYDLFNLDISIKFNKFDMIDFNKICENINEIDIKKNINKIMSWVNQNECIGVINDFNEAI